MKYGLIGEKLGHSFSKVIHESFAPYEYDLCEIPKDGLDTFMQKREFAAINVTIPYKQDVIPYLYYIDEAAERIGAVNTIVNKNGRLYGYNTDFFGLKMLLEKNGFDLFSKKVLILGSGGTSKTAAAVCEAMGASQIVKVGRKSEVNYENVKTLHADAEYIINTTPLGMFPNCNSSAVDLNGFEKLEGVADVVYNPLETKIVRLAKKSGLKGCCGLYMLVAQAVKASEIFLDKTYDDSVYEKAYNYVLSLKQNIVLVGMPGSGKSTIGKALAKKLSRPFIDTDELVVKNENAQISEIFARFGEDYFRKAETHAIEEAGANTGAVIATGGGAVLREENVDLLRSNGKLFFLNRPLQDILPTDDRPLARDRQALKNRFEERYPIYKSVCDKEIFVDGIVENSVLKIEKEFYSNEEI